MGHGRDLEETRGGKRGSEEARPPHEVVDQLALVGPPPLPLLLPVMVRGARREDLALAVPEDRPKHLQFGWWGGRVCGRVGIRAQDVAQP